MRKPRPKKLDKRYGWCGKANHGVIFDRADGCLRCETEKERKADGLCCAMLGHGPGHQSTTYCEKKGKHKVHECTYGSFDQHAEWTGPVHKMEFTGYFDDPPQSHSDS